MRRCILLFVLVACSSGTAARAGFFTNPTPSVTVTPTETILHMELNGFGNYGQMDAAADIAYTGDSNTWTFTIPGSVDLGDYGSAFFRASLVADDHYGVDPALYSFDIHTDGDLIYSGPANLPHGVPFGSVFTNWVQRDYVVLDILSSPMTFSLANTSSTGGGDWFAIDWIELHLVRPAAVPEPSSLALCAIGVAGAIGIRLARRLKGRHDDAA